MNRSLASVLAVATALTLAACGGDTDEGAETTTADTTTVTGTEVVDVPTTVPTTDTIVQTTTTETDTIHGDAPDTVHADTAHR